MREFDSSFDFIFSLSVGSYHLEIVTYSFKTWFRQITEWKRNAVRLHPRTGFFFDKLYPDGCIGIDFLILGFRFVVKQYPVYFCEYDSRDWTRFSDDTDSIDDIPF